MSAIVIGHPEAHEKLTAKLYWKLTSEKGYLDSGSVKDYVDATTRSLVVRARSTGGVRHVDTEQADTNHESWTFLLDERDANQERLVRLARQLPNKTQHSNEAVSATIQAVEPGRSFDIGSYNVSNVTVTASQSGAQEEGVDYELDKENGRIRIIPNAGIGDGETLTLTFDEPAVTMQKFQTQYNPLFYCDVVIEEHNQFSRMWLRRLSFRGYLNVTEFPSQTGEFGTYRVKATPSGPVTILKRPEAETLASHPSTTEGAGKSSSSSSSSSASDTRSSSSSSS